MDYIGKNKKDSVLFRLINRLKLERKGSYMAYVETIIEFNDAIEVEERHTGRYKHPYMARGPRCNKTSESMEKRNQANKEKRVRRKLRAHFTKGDYWITLTYSEVERPNNMDEAKKDLCKFIRRIRDLYKKAGITLKWMANIELTYKGNWHIHIILNATQSVMLDFSRLWTHGKHEKTSIDGQESMRKLAAYITKTPKTTDGILLESHYSCSRNMPIPTPTVNVYLNKTTWGELIIADEFYLEKSSYYEGMDPYTGYMYRTYTLLRIP